MTAKFAQLGCTVAASDFHPALIAMWQAAIAGWEPPTELSKEEHGAARSLHDGNPKKAFAEFGCSFGGKSWGWYAAGCNSMSPDTYPAIAARGIRKKVAAMDDRVTFAHASFFGLPIPAEPCILYCDPPYANTHGYRPGAFDSAAFWARCREWAVAGHDVFVSEYTAPADAEIVLTLERAQTMRISRGAGSQSDQVREERLYRVRP